MISRPTLIAFGCIGLLTLLGHLTGRIDADLLAPIAGGLVIIVLLLTVVFARDPSDL